MSEVLTLTLLHALVDFSSEIVKASLVLRAFCGATFIMVVQKQRSTINLKFNILLSNYMDASS